MPLPNRRKHAKIRSAPIVVSPGMRPACGNAVKGPRTQSYKLYPPTTYMTPFMDASLVQLSVTAS